MSIIKSCICDRCGGVVFTRTGHDIMSRDEDPNFFSIKIMRLRKTDRLSTSSYETDLCDDCANELLIFLNQKPIKEN